MASTVSLARAPYTSALLLLVIIWSVWYVGTSARISQVQGVITETASSLHESIFHEAPQSQGDLLRLKDAVVEPKKKTGDRFKATEAEAKNIVEDLVGNLQPEATAVARKMRTSKRESFANSSVVDRSLILYTYTESPATRSNLQFFLQHGLHRAADFVFILNGPTDVMDLLPVHMSNIEIVKRSESCYDLGAYSEVLIEHDRYKKYSKFLMLSAELRGPFLPYWSDVCWSSRYLDALTDTVKLVGMTASCYPHFHIPSGLWALDAQGLMRLLFPPTSDGDDQDVAGATTGINECFSTWEKAIEAERTATKILLESSFQVDVMMRPRTELEMGATCVNMPSSQAKWLGILDPKHIRPYETMFLRGDDALDAAFKDLPGWTSPLEYSSYDLCR